MPIYTDTTREHEYVLKEEREGCSNPVTFLLRCPGLELQDELQMHIAEHTEILEPEGEGDREVRVRIDPKMHTRLLRECLVGWRGWMNPDGSVVEPRTYPTPGGPRLMDSSISGIPAPNRVELATAILRLATVGELEKES